MSSLRPFLSREIEAQPPLRPGGAEGNTSKFERKDDSLRDRGAWSHQHRRPGLAWENVCAADVRALWTTCGEADLRRLFNGRTARSGDHDLVFLVHQAGC